MKLSVIIPIYNVKPFLPKCLDSVICPDLADYEIIAVNDGSTDGSQDIITEYRQRFPGLIRRVDTPNGGLGHARNTGIEAARGEYLLFLDGDDFLRPGALPEILNTIDDSFQILIFDFHSVNEQGDLIKTMSGCARNGSFTLAEYPELLFELGNACNKLFHRSLFTDTGIRFPDRMWFEDICTVLKLYPLAKKIKAVPMPWYNYLQRNGSITNSSNTERNLEIIKSVDIILDHYKSIGQYETYAAQLEYMAFYNQLLTSTTRVNLIDRESTVQDALLEDFLKKFPDFAANPYIRSMPKKYKLLLFLILHRRHLALNLVMRLNNRIKGK